MVTRFKNALSNPLLSGSLIMLIGSNILNVCQFAFHFLSGRFLGKAEYGDLAAIISILGIFGVLQLGLTLTIVKFISTQENKQKLDDFINWIFRISIKGSLFLGVVILLASPLISNFLNLSKPASVFFLGPIVAVFILTLTIRAIFQGLIKFNLLATSLVIEALGKIILLVVLINLGFAIFGALLSTLIATLLSAVYLFFVLKSYLNRKIKIKPDLSKLLKYTYFVLIQGMALTSMYSLDLLLVKHFFSPEEAGMYAALAILGRIVFFGASPVTQVMFPLVSKKHGRGENYSQIIFISLGLIVVYSVIVTAFYYFYPNLALGILYGESYLEGSKLLWWYGAFMSMLAISMLMTQFYLSVHKTWISILFAVVAIAQVVLIWFIHTDLISVIKISLLLSSLLVVVLLLYFPYHKK